MILSFSAGARNIERECSSISISFCSFLYNGVCFDGLNLSINDIHVLDTMEKCVKDKKLLSAL